MMNYPLEEDRRTGTPRWLLAVVAAVSLVAIGLLALGVWNVLSDGDDDASAIGPVALEPVPSTPPITQPPAPTTQPPAPATTVPPSTTAPPPERDPIVVPGTVSWTDSGIDVKAGDLVHFLADGSVNSNTPDPASEVGPAGDPRPELTQFNLPVDGVPMPGNHAGLVGRIGDGEPFVLGASGTVTASGDGPLFLGVNDQGVENNSGEFSVVLEVQTS